MRRDEPKFVSELRAEVMGMPGDVLQRLMRPGGLDLGDMFDMLASNESHDVLDPARPDHEDVLDITEVADAILFRDAGDDLTRSAAVCIDATDVNEQGEPRALAGGVLNSLLALRVSQTARVFARKWVLTTPQHFRRVQDALLELDALDYDVVSSHETIQITPMNALRSRELLPCGSGDVIVSLWNAGKLLDFTDAGGKHVVYLDGASIGRFVPELLGVHSQRKNPVTFGMRPADHRARLCRHVSFPSGVGLVRATSCYPISAYEALPWSWSGVAVFDAYPDFEPNEWKWKWHKTRRVYKGEVVSQFQRHFEDYSEFGANYVLARF